MDYSSILSLLEKHAPKPKPKLPDPTEIRVLSTKQVLHKKHGRGWRIPLYAVKAMKAEYDRLGTLGATGKLFGITKSEVGKLFMRNGIKVPKAPPRPRINYKGHDYIFDGLRYYGRSGRGQQGKHLHKVIWEERHGKVPPGHYLVFLTDNRQDFSDDNLKLMTGREYFQHVRAGRTKKKLP